MKNLRIFNRGFVLLAGLLLITFSCQDSTEPDEKVEPSNPAHVVDMQSNEFSGPIPEATVPLIDYSRKNKEINSAASVAGSSLTPLVEATLKEGESHTETLTGTVAGAPSAGDVMFVLDLTGSMGGVLNNAKVNSINIMNAINGLIPNTNFGLMSHMDYVGSFSGCGYASTYGGSMDYPYSLDAALTADLATVSSGINGLTLGYGYDGPENYTRPLWELSNDTNIGWRDGSKKIAIAWLDNVPHDCEVYSLIGGSGTTGPDPGRDGIVGTPDDLAFVQTLEELKANNISLITLFNGPSGSTFDLWSAASQLTGGQAYQVNSDGSIIGGGDIAEFIAGLIADNLNTIDALSIESCDPAYTSWLSMVAPDAYTGLVLDEPISKDFDVTLTVPAGTAAGVYTFDLCLIGDGAEYARTEVTINVPEEIEVAFDVHPGSCPNPIATKRNGVIPMAVLGQPGFDVNDIDVSTITLEGIAPESYGYEDVSTPYQSNPDKPVEANDCHTLGADGQLDLTLKFDNQLLLNALGAVSGKEVLTLTIKGQLKDGTKFTGQDVIWIR